jgi:hypothetical protein
MRHTGNEEQRIKILPNDFMLAGKAGAALGTNVSTRLLDLIFSRLRHCFTFNVSRFSV